MGLFDKLKQQGMNILQQGENSLNKLTNNQEYIASQQLENPTGPTGHQDFPLDNQPAPPAANSTHNNSIYGDHIERLIEMALADGELTEKEKQVLFKKAEAQGIDLDEFEMVLDAKLYEKQKAMNIHTSIQNTSAPNSNKYGEIKKCPSCGAIVESFKARCQDCGYEFRNIGSISSFTLLSSKIEALQAKKNGSFFSLNDENINVSIKSLIDNFPIPTTKEDILEFLTMAIPLGKPALKNYFFSDLNEGQYKIAKAWKAKCEQVIMKARFSMKGDKALLEEIEHYAKQLKIR